MDQARIWSAGFPYIALAILVCVGFFSSQAKSAPGSEGSATSSVFARNTPLINETNQARGRRASTVFPKDPTIFFALVQTAREMMRGDDCSSAVALLERATREYSDHGNVWALLGACRNKLGAWDGAIEAFKKALELGVQPWDLDLDEVDLNPNDMMIKIAGAYAQAGNTEQALVWLRRGLEARYDGRPDIAELPAFANLVGSADFATLAGLAPEGTLTRDEEWRYDIAFLREQVAMLHADPDHLTSAPELERMLSELSAEVPDLNDEEITTRLNLFIGALGGGHDLFWTYYPKRGAMVPFALKLYFFTDGLYILDAYDPELIGARIDAFGSTPTAEAYDIIANAFPGDNDMEARWVGVRHLAQAYTLELLGIIDDAKTATLTITDKNGVQRTITPERRPFASMGPALKAPPGIKAPLYLSWMNEYYWMRPLEEMKALYIQLNTEANGDESLAEFAERMGREAAKPGIENLILDLRHSGGGNGYLTPPFIRQLIRFDATPEKGHLYVIIGRNTFSASQNLIVDLDWLAEPIFVGEPSGSSPNAMSESGNFVLPFSGLSGSLSSQFIQHSWPEDHRIWIAPDVPVGLSSKDFFSGRDPSLEAIRKLIENE